MKEKIADKSHEIMAKWEEKSREFVGNFMELFGRDGRIVSGFLCSYDCHVIHIYDLWINNCTLRVWNLCFALQYDTMQGAMVH